MTRTIRILGIDPGLRRTGWGVIDYSGNHLSHVDNGVVVSDANTSLAERLASLFRGLDDVVAMFEPDSVAVEQMFVNKDASATLKLGQARGIALLAPALRNLDVAEYAPNLVKKTVVGAGHAGKEQIRAMVRILLPNCDIAGADEADALAIAICHAHHQSSAGQSAMRTPESSMPHKQAIR